MEEEKCSISIERKIMASNMEKTHDEIRRDAEQTLFYEARNDEVEKKIVQVITQIDVKGKTVKDVVREARKQIGL